MGDTTMAKPLLPDTLWERIQPLLPPRPKPQRPDRPGRPPSDDRQAWSGILVVLKTGMNWEDLPRERGCGSGMTCWRRWSAGTKAGVWQKVPELLVAAWPGADTSEGTRAMIDSSFVRARGGGGKTGPRPGDRRTTGSQHPVITAAGGAPWVAATTAAHVPEVDPRSGRVAAMPPVRGKPGRPRRRPDRLDGDRGSDSDPPRKKVRRRGLRPPLARRRTAHGSGLGESRGVVERTWSWLHAFGRLRGRTDRSPAIHQAFLTLGCIIICRRLLC
jgi:transposase